MILIMSLPIPFSSYGLGDIKDIFVLAGWFLLVVAIGALIVMLIMRIGDKIGKKMFKLEQPAFNKGEQWKAAIIGGVATLALIIWIIANMWG